MRGARTSGVTPQSWRMAKDCGADTSSRRSSQGLRSFQVHRGGPAGAPIRFQVEADLLALDETEQAGPLERRGVDEHVPAAASGLDESIAPLRVVPFDLALVHKNYFR